MKFSITVLCAILGFSQAFVVAPSRSSTSNTQLQMDRREVVSKTAGLVAAGVLFGPQNALAADYVPKFDDMKQIYFLGASLDKLVDKLSNPDTVEVGLDGIRQFNRDPKFYPGYAKNFIQKSVKTGSDSDPRLGYVKQVG